MTASEAFHIAVPRSPAVLCLPHDGDTELIAVDWFTWLNLTHQPMLSYAMQRSARYGLELKSGDELYLAFPSAKETALFKSGICASPDALQDGSGKTPAVRACGSVLVPSGSEIVLKCTLSRAYNFPFKKVRIFNCNFEEAVELKQET